MTKAEVVELLSKNGNIPKKQAELIVNTVFSAIAEALDNGEKVELRGFGTFKVKEKKPHTARNPKTGEQVFVKGRRVPYFKPGRDLKKLVNS